ncbi:MAG: Ig-like domain-containing protein [Clostridia bacterium]|nr:Ig-like domain-containing protein [Clostridia bacterium]
MMKRVWTLLLAAMIVLLAVSAQAEAVFAFEKAAYEVNAGKSIKLQPVLQGAEKPRGSKYVWSSSDKTVAAVSSGKVTGKGGGTATITVQLQDGKKNVLYETSCRVTVLQPVKKITPDSDKPITLVVSAQKKGKADYTYQLNPDISPADASNQELLYTTNRPDLVRISQSGLVTTLFTTEGGTATIFMEAKDGSGAKAKQKIKVQPFDTTVETIEMTERGVYRLYIPTPAPTPGVLLLPTVKVSGGGVQLENIAFEDFYEKWQPAKVENYVAWFDIRPLKAGTYTLTLDSIPGFWAFDCTKKIKLKVSESAAYGEASFPEIKYASAMKDPAAMTGRQVTVEGRLREAYRDEDGRWCYVVATKGSNENEVIVRAPRGRGKLEYISGDKITVLGAFAEPLLETTETGLKLYKLVVDIEKAGLVYYNANVYEIDMYQPEWEEAE